MSRNMELVMKMSLRDFFRCAPGDNCPDNTCGGFFDTINCSWTNEGVTIDAICGRCGQSWCIYEDLELGIETAVHLEKKDVTDKRDRRETLPHGSK